MRVGNTPADFRDALLGLERGDFSRLEPLFVAETNGDEPCQVVQWHAAGLFGDQPEALANYAGTWKAMGYFIGAKRLDVESM